MRHIYCMFAVYGRAPGGLDRALDQLFLRHMAPSKFTEAIPETRVFLATFLLREACLDFPRLAAWMLDRGARPTPGQCDACILALTSGGPPEPFDRGVLVRGLRARGGNINAEVGGETALVKLLDLSRYYKSAGWRGRAGNLLQALLEMPELLLEIGGESAETVARRMGHGWIADLVFAARAPRERWSELRASWIASVLRAPGRSVP